MNIFSRFLWNIGLYSRRKEEELRIERMKQRETDTDWLDGAISEVSFTIDWIKQHPEKWGPGALAQPLIKRADFYCQKGDFAAAKKDYQSIVDLRDSLANEGLHYWRIEAFGGLAKVDKLALKGLPQKPPIPQTKGEAEAEHLYQLGLCALNDKRSRKYFSRVIEANDASPAIRANALMERASLSRPWGGIQKGDHSQAIADLTTALAVAGITEEQKQRALSLRADFLRQTTCGNDKDNQRHADQDEETANAIAMTREPSFAHLRRAYAKIKADDVEGAIADFDRSLELGSSEFSDLIKGEVYWRRAELHHRSGHWHEAISDYTRALINRPGTSSDEWCAKIYLDRGACKQAAGDYIGAKQDFEKVMAMTYLNKSYKDEAHLALSEMEHQLPKQ